MSGSNPGSALLSINLANRCSSWRCQVIDVTLLVINSEDGRDLRELRSVLLPGVPRVGESVVAEGTTWEVREVTWSEQFVSLYVYSESYGIGFPMPPAQD